MLACHEWIDVERAAIHDARRQEQMGVGVPRLAALDEIGPGQHDERDEEARASASWRTDAAPRAQPCVEPRRCPAVCRDAAHHGCHGCTRHLTTTPSTTHSSQQYLLAVPTCGRAPWRVSPLLGFLSPYRRHAGSPVRSGRGPAGDTVRKAACAPDRWLSRDR